MIEPKYILTFSGGKDSEATLIWAKNNLPAGSWEVVFCDTGWEDQKTYDHIDAIERRLGMKFIKLKSQKFDDRIDPEVLKKIFDIFGERNVFAEMVIKKGRFPSTKARFCTEILKSEPMIDYVLSKKCDVIIVQGVCAEESEARRNMKASEEYFKFYFEPYRIDKTGRERFHTYRKEDIHAHCDKYSVDVIRPILTWTANDVFNYTIENGFEINPLYFQGHSRVGCYPCIMCRHSEIILIWKHNPDRIRQLAAFEAMTNSTFFPPRYIPSKHCTKTAMVKFYFDDMNAKEISMYKDNKLIEVFMDDDEDLYILKRMKVPTVMDVINYLVSNPNQQDLFPAGPSCVSVYNICETGK